MTTPAAIPASSGFSIGAFIRNGGVLFFILLNVVCSVSTIAVNKIIFSRLHFRFVIFLSAIHFFAGAGLLQILSSCCNAFPASSSAATNASSSSSSTGLSIRSRILRLAFVGATSIVATNFSLRYNAIGTYQILKAAVLPVVMVMALLQGKNKPDRISIICAIGIVSGSLLSILSDISINSYGIFIGLTGVLLTAQYQIWGGTEQKELGLSPSQVMFASALPQALMTLGASFIMESSFLTYINLSSLSFTTEGTSSTGNSNNDNATGDDIFSFPWNTQVVSYILLSALFAIGLNYSSFAILGKTNATTMQVINQTKTILIIATDFILFPKTNLSAGRAFSFLLGIIMVVGGASWYGFHVSQPSVASSSSSVSSSSSSHVSSSKEAGDEENGLLLSSNPSTPVLPLSHNSNHQNKSTTKPSLLSEKLGETMATSVSISPKDTNE